MNISVREAAAADIAAVSELFDCYRRFYEQPPDLPLARTFITDRIINCESVILVADSNPSGMAGFCQLYPSFCSVEAKPIYVLYDLFVLPLMRKSGVGRTLLQAAEARALVDGKKRIDLTTARTNTPAQALYESAGWARDDIFFAYNRWIT